MLISELAEEHFSSEFTRPTFKMHGLCAFTTQPESQRTKRRKQAPWTIGYKPESVEHSDPAHGLFTFIPIVKNRNGFPPFKDQNTTLGFLAWNGGGRKS